MSFKIRFALFTVIASLLTFLSCDYNNKGESHVKFNRLVERNDTTYQVNSNSPFTGVGVDSTENVMTLMTYYDNGKRDGLYKEFHENTQLKVKGAFEAGVKEGQWIEYYSNGVVKSEFNFENGTLNDSYKTFYENGNKKVEAKYTNGKYNGSYLEFSVTGDTILSANLDKGTLIGDLYYELDSLSISNSHSRIFNLMNNLVDPHPNDSPFFYQSSIERNTDLKEVRSSVHENFQRVKGTFVEGEKDGIWVFFDENSTLLEIEYSRGIKNGKYVKYYMDSESLLVDGTYKNDKRIGKWKTYYPNGEIELNMNFENGELDGDFRKYFDDGGLKKEGEYVSGIKNGEWFKYTDDGKLMMKNIYDTENTYLSITYNKQGEVIRRNRLNY